MKKALLLFIVSFSVLLYGQDLHLSQFYTNKMSLNPALSGNYEGKYQFTGNYRSQWSEVGIPLNTVFIAFDKKFFFYTDEFSIGVLFNDDQYAGFSQKVNKILLNGTYTKRIGKHKVSAGIQLGAILRSTSFKHQTFPNQWVYETGQFDDKVYNGEVNLASNQSFMDASLGFVWTRKYNKIKPLLGFTLFHINRPKDSYSEVFIERLRMRKAFFGELNWQAATTILIEPKLLYMWTTKAQDLVIGTNIKKQFNSKVLKNIYAGVLMRSGFGRNIDAVIPTVGMTIKNFDLGFSYDVNVSEISKKNSQKTSLEYSLIYTAPIFNPAKLSIPCDRY